MASKKNREGNETMTKQYPIRMSIEKLREKIRQIEEEEIPEALQMKEDMKFIQFFNRLLVRVHGD